MSLDPEEHRQENKVLQLSNDVFGNTNLSIFLQ